MRCALDGISIFIIDCFHRSFDISAIRFHDLNGLTYSKFISLGDMCEAFFINFLCIYKISIFLNIGIIIIDLRILIWLAVEESCRKLTVGAV